MDAKHIETDYLVIGAGATAMAFVDSLLDQSDASVVMHPPKYRVAEGVRCVAPNELPRIGQAPSGYVVVGAGKTGIDTCLWLLANEVPPERIRWIMPRDPWLIDRANVQPGPDHFERFMGSIALQLEAIGASTSIAEMFERLERTGQLLRIDPAVEPGMYRCATISQAELRELRRITRVVRLGHVRAIEPGRIELDRGSIETSPGCLHVDCSAAGLVHPPPVPVFADGTINLLMVRTCQPVFSAALIGVVECQVPDALDQNAMCQVVPSPQRPVDFLRMWAVTMANRYRWGQHEGVAGWLAGSRLDGIVANVAAIKETETGKLAMVERYRAAARQAAANMPKLLSTIQ